jgi:hypothetical protein
MGIYLQQGSAASSTRRLFSRLFLFLFLFLSLSLSLFLSWHLSLSLFLASTDSVEALCVAQPD